jgi:hypothetical protein
MLNVGIACVAPGLGVTHVSFQAFRRWICGRGVLAADRVPLTRRTTRRLGEALRHRLQAAATVVSHSKNGRSSSGLKISSEVVATVCTTRSRRNMRVVAGHYSR